MKKIFKNGDLVNWDPSHPNHEIMLRDFGPGPFEVFGAVPEWFGKQNQERDFERICFEYPHIEPASDSDGFVGLKRVSDGLVWSHHRKMWESASADEPGLGRAQPETFHSQWLRKVKAAPPEPSTRRIDGAHFHFDVGKGLTEEAREGKPEWAHSIHCFIPRDEAQRILKDLTHTLQNSDDETVYIRLWGELTEE